MREINARRILAACLVWAALLPLAAELPSGAPPPGAPPVGGAGVPGGVIPGGGQAQAKTDHISRKWLDVTYATQSPTQKLDIYLPETGSGLFPVILSIHGGGFMLGSRKSGELEPMLAGLARGYAVVSVDYRLSGEARFPAAVHDLKAAVRFIRANGARFLLDPKRIAAWGGSAGGNLAALMAVTSGNAFLEGDLGNPTESSAVQAFVDWYGPIWFSSMDAEFAALGQTPKMGATNRAESPESKYLGKTIGSEEAISLVAAASPLSYLDPSDPPGYIQHGDADRNIPLTQSRNFAAKLEEKIGAGKVKFEALPGAGHGGGAFNTPENLAKIYAFLDAALKR